MSRKDPIKRGKWINEEETALSGIVAHMLSEGKTVSNLDWEEISNTLAKRIGGDHRGHKAVLARWKMLDQSRSYDQVKAEVIEVNQTEKPNEVNRELIAPVLNNAIQVLTTLSNNAVAPSTVSIPQVPLAAMTPVAATMSTIPQVQSQIQQQPQQQRGKLLKCGGMLLDLGRFTIYSDDFPVGYKLVRPFPSMYSRTVSQYKLSTAYDEIKKKIVFQVEASDGKGEVLSDEVPSEVWTLVQIRIIMTWGDYKYWQSHISAGVKMFGLIDPEVLGYLSVMPRVNRNLPSNPSTFASPPLKPFSLKSPPLVPQTQAQAGPSTSSTYQISPTASTSLLPHQSPILPTNHLQSYQHQQPQSVPLENQQYSPQSSMMMNRRTSVESNSGTPNSIESWRGLNSSNSPSQSLPFVAPSPILTSVLMASPPVHNTGFAQSPPSENNHSLGPARSISAPSPVTNVPREEVATRVQPKRRATITREISKDAYLESRSSSDIEPDDGME